MDLIEKNTFLEGIPLSNYETEINRRRTFAIMPPHNAERRCGDPA